MKSVGTVGRKTDTIWNSFIELSSTTPIKFQCKSCYNIITMSRRRADRLKEHAGTCRAYRPLPAPRSQRPQGNSKTTPASPPPTTKVEVTRTVLPVFSSNGDDGNSTFLRSTDSNPHTSSHSPIAISSTVCESSSPAAEGLSKPKKIRLSASSLNSLNDGYFIRTTDDDRERMRQKWAEFFYKNRLSFRLADDPSFRASLEETRPGISGPNGSKPLLTRKALSGKLLDEAEDRCSTKLNEALGGKYAVLSQDGWTDTHQEPVIAASLHCNGKTYTLDFEATGTNSKTAAFCAELAKRSIEKAERKYGCTIVGFVSDSEAKMINLRTELAKWRDLMVYGCSAHALNLVENTATPRQVMAPIVAVAKYFREHHKPAALLKEYGGVLPQLPNDTRWTSQTEALQTFIRNYEYYGRVVDGDEVQMPHHIKTFINNRGLVSEAKAMLAQLEFIAAALKGFQVNEFLEVIH